jgi:hypothetical protein
MFENPHNKSSLPGELARQIVTTTQSCSFMAVAEFRLLYSVFCHHRHLAEPTVNETAT